MAITPQEAQQALAEADCVHDRAAVAQALDRMASEITATLHDTNPLVLGVMHGGLIVAAELLLRLQFPLQQDYIHATRYRGSISGGVLHWIARSSHPLKDRTVLIVDDIYDEGVTLEAIAQACRDDGAAAVYTAVLVNKLHDRKKGVRPDFIGLSAPDRYLFGYGMDYKGYLRNAPGIYAVKDL